LFITRFYLDREKKSSWKPIQRRGCEKLVEEGKKITDTDPSLMEDLDALIEPVTRGG
jgi:hypothetical protein